MIENEQIAHGLAMAYVNNRYGAEVTGSFEVSTFGDEVSGEGGVDTERLPDVDEKVMIRVGTGERHFLGLLEKKQQVETGEYTVDPIFMRMIADYYGSRARFLELLEYWHGQFQ